MESIAAPHGILLASELRMRDGDDRGLRHAERRGELVRVHRGAYMRASDWWALEPHERYRRRVIAASLAASGGPVLSHQSAASIWGIPTIAADTRLIHVLATRSAGSRTEHGFRKHAAEPDDDDVVEFDGVRVTSLARTLIDLARESTFASAVAGLDWSIRPARRGVPPRITIDALQEYFSRQTSLQHRRKVHRALEFASPLAESPGESFSRATIHELGFPAPVLQYRVDDARGHAGTCDFAWPEVALLGEFDGKVKYTRNLARPGESVDDIVLREKLREDRLRATGRRMSRWVWSEVLDAAMLRNKLVAANLPLRRSGRVRLMRAGAPAQIRRNGPDPGAGGRSSAESARIPASES